MKKLWKNFFSEAVSAMRFDYYVTFRWGARETILQDASGEMYMNKTQILYCNTNWYVKNTVQSIYADTGNKLVVQLT